MDGAVRKASLEDMEEIGRVHYEAHIQTYSGKFPNGVIESFTASHRAKMWTQFLTGNFGELWVAEFDGWIVWPQQCPFSSPNGMPARVRYP